MTAGPRGPTAGQHCVRRAILWLNAREPIDWFLGFVIALLGVAMLGLATLLVSSIRRGDKAPPTWGDFRVLLLVLGSGLVVIVVWTVCWRRVVAWARCPPARAPETVAAPDPFEEAARREVDELTRDTP